MSKSPYGNSDTPGIFLMRRAGWFHRVMMVPEKPATGDRKPVMDALVDLIDAGGGLEFSRGELLRIIAIAQAEYDSLQPGLGKPSEFRSWGGATTPAVYFAFFEAATWTRTIKDRFEGPLKAAVQPQDSNLWNRLQRIRSQSVGGVFEDARGLASTNLHWYSPPYAGCGAKIVEGKLIYPIVDSVDDREDFRNNMKFDKGRHAEVVVEEYWNSTCHFIDGILDEFYPKGLIT